MYEILIVGGGPAGLTAAIYAARAGKHVAVLERGSTGGQIISAPLVENYPGIPSVSGTELARHRTCPADDRTGVHIRRGDRLYRGGGA